MATPVKDGQLLAPFVYCVEVRVYRVTRKADFRHCLCIGKACLVRELVLDSRGMTMAWTRHPTRRRCRIPSVWFIYKIRLSEWGCSVCERAKKSV